MSRPRGVHNFLLFPHTNSSKVSLVDYSKTGRAIDGKINDNPHPLRYVRARFINWFYFSSLFLGKKRNQDYPLYICEVLLDFSHYSALYILLFCFVTCSISLFHSVSYLNSPLLVILCPQQTSSLLSRSCSFPFIFPSCSTLNRLSYSKEKHISNLIHHYLTFSAISCQR